jgi:hypothetical protein
VEYPRNSFVCACFRLICLHNDTNFMKNLRNSMLNSSVKQLVIEKNYMLMHKLSGIHISIEYDYGVELIQNYESWSASEFVEQ